MIPSFRVWDKIGRKMYYPPDCSVFIRNGVQVRIPSGHINRHNHTLMWSMGMRDCQNKIIYQEDILYGQSWWKELIGSYKNYFVYIDGGIAMLYISEKKRRRLTPNLIERMKLSVIGNTFENHYLIPNDQ